MGTLSSRCRGLHRTAGLNTRRGLIRNCIVALVSPFRCFTWGVQVASISPRLTIGGLYCVRLDGTSFVQNRSFHLSGLVTKLVPQGRGLKGSLRSCSSVKILLLSAFQRSIFLSELLQVMPTRAQLRC